ncbi:hypothetical protein [Paenibacillus protaetiae]|uniref:Tetratricopeptide repeat protein n=1 Tax=Paenibacillus protaetiae TaxID=2509456 RepID=A0A4P6EYK6_9BACL|nr:hypothetical protein [Paenibacillus protaetiae]QAY67815.1 hypothetical protein ET464_16880 [Paenibacillus protaetiae]
MIRVKVRTVLLMAIILVISGWVVYTQLPSILYHNKQYDTLLRLYPEHRLAQQALYQSGMNAFDVHDDYNNYYFIFPDSKSWSGAVHDKAELQEAEQKLKRLIANYNNSSSIVQAKYKLGILYIQEKRWDEAEQQLKEVAAAQKPDVFFQTNELQGWLAMLETRHTDIGKTPLLEGTVTMDGKPAADAFVVLKDKALNGWVSNPFGNYPIAITDAQGKYRFYGDGKGGEAAPKPAVLKGVGDYSVYPIEYEVGVGMTPAELSGYYLGGTTPDSVTIRNGSTAAYNINFVPQMEIISPVNKTLIDGNQITFKWKPYPGAYSYQIQIINLQYDRSGRLIESYSSYYMDDLWKDAEATYSVSFLRTYLNGYSKSYDGKSVTLQPSSILGAVFPGGKFTWSVTAFTKEGKILSSSDGYYTGLQDKPLFQMPDDGQLEGDRLVLQQRYAEAIEAYKREGDNDFALRALAVMALYGIAQEDNGNPAQAIAYLERIKEPTVRDLRMLDEAREKLKQS